MKKMRIKGIVTATILIVALAIIPSACKAPAAFEVTSMLWLEENINGTNQ